MNKEIDMLITQLEYRGYIQQDYKHMIIDYLKKYKNLQHQLEEKDKVIKKQSRIINQAYNNIENTYNWRKNHSTSSTIDVPLMTLCEEQLKILERGKND